MRCPIPSPPIEVRRARSWAAQFFVKADAAQRLLPNGLEVTRPVPGRAVLVLAVVRYEDTDLDAYNEVAVSFLVRPPGAPPAKAVTREFFRGEVGVYIRHLPVTQAFTLDAGRTLWGYPKTLADISITEGPKSVTCLLSQDGRDVMRLRIRTDGFLRLPDRPAPTYSMLDGTLVRTDWNMTGSRPRMRPGGANIELGPHAMAAELRGLGLPKRAVATQTIDELRASFAAPVPVSAPASTP